jgi:hypothetical protein
MNKVKWFVFTEVIKAVRGHGQFALETNMPSCLIPSAIKLMCDMRWYILSLLFDYRDGNTGDGGNTNKCNLS